MKRLVIIELAAVTVLAALAALGFHRVFVGQGFVGVLLAAAVTPVAVSAVAGWRKASFSGAMLASLAAFVGYALFVPLADLTSTALPTLVTFEELGRGLTSGWADLRTVSLPTPDTPRLLVTASAVVWFGAALGAELAQRSTSPVAPAIGPLAGYAASLAIAAGQPHSSVALPLAVTASALLLMLVHANRYAAVEPAGRRLRTTDDEQRRSAAASGSADRRIVLGLPVIALALVVAGLTAAALDQRPEDQAFDPQPLRAADTDLREAPSPLASLHRELTLDPPAPAFTMEVDGLLSEALSVPRVRRASFDHYDGATWTAEGEFASAGSVLAEPPPAATGSRIDQDYVLGPLEGPWLPAADFPVGIDTGDDTFAVDYDPASAMLITDRDDLEGLTYRVSSIVPDYDELALSDAEPGTAEDLPDAVFVPPDIPEAIPALAESLSSAAVRPYDQLVELASGLASTYGYSEEVNPGHSYGHLEQFLVEERVGYAEQFATAFAVMARTLGYPSRVSVGYLTVEEDPDSDQLTPIEEVTTRQAHVWPEVYFEDFGWVPFEPTPQREASEPPKPRAPEQLASGGGLVEEQSPPAGSTDEVSPEPNTDDGGLGGRFVALVLLLSLVAAMALGLVLAKVYLRRRRRRLAATPAAAVLGAWAEVTDRLLEVGVPLDRAMTARQVAALSADWLSPNAAARLDAMVPLVSYALFSPAQPSAERVEEMWENASAFGQDVLRTRHVGARLVAMFNPRPLLYHAKR